MNLRGVEQPRRSHYSFDDIHSCNMCGSEASSHKVLGKRLSRSQGWNPRSKSGIATTVMRCRSCGLVYANPQPLPLSLQDHYDILPADYWKEKDRKISDRYLRALRSELRAFLSYEEGARALDIGSGLGECVTALREAGFDAYGIEPSKAFHAAAIEMMKVNPEQLRRVAIEDAEFPEGFFDWIIFRTVLEHLRDPSAAIQKALKWLKPNGLIYIEVPSADWLLSKLANLFFRIRMTDYVTNISPMHSPFHLYEFTLKSFIEHGRQNDYEVVSHRYLVCATYLPRLLDVLLRPIMKWTDTGMEVCVWLRKAEGRQTKAP